MRSRRTPNPRVIAVLKMPEYDVPLFIVRARAIVKAMDRNAWFPDPNPPLDTLRAAIEDLSEAETATRGRKGVTAERDEKRLDLNRLLHRERDYVQKVADSNPEHAPSIIESASMSVKETRALPARVFAAFDGAVAGTARVEIPVAADRAS